MAKKEIDKKVEVKSSCSLSQCFFSNDIKFSGPNKYLENMGRETSMTNSRNGFDSFSSSLMSKRNSNLPKFKKFKRGRNPYSLESIGMLIEI